MTQAISKTDYILETLKKLTPQQQQEVLDFIEFLHFKVQKQEQTPEEEPISMLEAAAEFIGCVEGPPDLSMRKKIFKKGHQKI